jgi:hypothetical protein
VGALAQSLLFLPKNKEDRYEMENNPVAIAIF